MTTRSQPPVTPPRPTPGPLVDCLIALAGTPDDSSWITSQLVAVTQLAAELAAPPGHASVTTYRDDGYVTVAASSDAAFAIDEARGRVGHVAVMPRGADLVAGLTTAFAVRALIQDAIRGVMIDSGRTADAAYLLLRLRAAETGISLADTASAVVAERQWRSSDG